MTAPTHGAVLDAETTALIFSLAERGHKTPGCDNWRAVSMCREIAGLARPTPEGEATPSITAPMESETAIEVSKRAKALSELAALDGETMDLPAQPEPGAGELCDCELSQNGVGLSGRECDCPAGGTEAKAWKYLVGRYPNDAPSDLAYAADEMVDAFIAGAGSAQAKIARLEGDVAAHRHGERIAQMRADRAETDAAKVRDNRQTSVAEWCARCFGDDHAASLPQRGIRLAEEAIEAAQAATCDRDMLHKLVDYVYDRPVGEIGQELGGVGVTLLALANAAGLSADQEEAREVARVLAKPAKHFTERNRAKNEAGFNVTGGYPVDPHEALAAQTERRG